MISEPIPMTIVYQSTDEKHTYELNVKATKFIRTSIYDLITSICVLNHKGQETKLSLRGVYKVKINGVEFPIGEGYDEELQHAFDTIQSIEDLAG
jgi:hypothetical protein